MVWTSWGLHACFEYVARTSWRNTYLHTIRKLKQYAIACVRGTSQLKLYVWSVQPKMYTIFSAPRYPCLLVARCLVKEKHHWKAHPNAERFRVFFLFRKFVASLLSINRKSSIRFAWWVHISVVKYYDGKQHVSEFARFKMFQIKKIIKIDRDIGKKTSLGRHLVSFRCGDHTLSL